VSNNQLKAGSLLTYVQMALSIIIGLVYTPIMIRLLGQSEYGLYSTVSSTVAMLSILNLGFGSGYIRYFTRYTKEKNEQAIAKLNGLFMLIFLAIGVLALVCGLYLSFNLKMVFDTGLTAQEYDTAKTLFILLTVNLALSFPMSLFSCIISANERFIFLKTLNIFKTVIGPLVTLPVLLMGFRSVAMVVISVSISLIADIVNILYAFKVLNVKFVFKNPDKQLFGSLFSYTMFIALNLVIDQINTNVDVLLLGRFVGTDAVAVYAVGFALFNYYMMFSTAISSVFTPRIHTLVNETKNDRSLQRLELTDLFVKVGRIQYLILALIATGVVFFGRSFITEIWVTAEYANAYPVTFLLILPATIPFTQNLGIEIQRAQNKHQFRSISYFFMALINLGLTIYLCPRFGAVGAALGTAISFLLANGLIMNIYYHKKCNIDILTFWKNILSVSKGLIIPVLAGLLMTRCVDTSTIPMFLGVVLLYCVIYGASMWILGMNAYEKALVLMPLKKVVKKVHGNDHR